MPRPILEVDGLRLSVAGNLLFRDLSFELKPIGVTGVMGPVGTGKSSLLKWICGKADPSIYTSDVRRTEYFHGDLARANRPPLLGQKAARSFEETMIMINAMLRSNPALICLDEVTARLSDAERRQVQDRIAAISASRAVLMVSHNQAEVRDLSDSVVLLAGGRLQEHTPKDDFFARPRSVAGQEFIRTGGVGLPGIATPAHDLRPDLRGVPDGVPLDWEDAPSDAPLRVVLENRLYLLREIVAADFTPDDAMLDRLGVSTLIFVDATQPKALDKGDAVGPERIWFPMVLNPSVSISEVRRLVRGLEATIARREKVVLVDTSDPANAQRVAAIFLTRMGLAADRAAQALASFLPERRVSLADEQLLWDLELALDLEKVGADFPAVSDSALYPKLQAPPVTRRREASQRQVAG